HFDYVNPRAPKGGTLTLAAIGTFDNFNRYALRGEPKYAAGFSHFDYVNPRAPKGGTLTLAAIGTFDNFNRYALRG
ncbi:hypothetical protein CKQ90_35360, partial [Klebsiella pneumoniae]